MSVHVGHRAGLRAIDPHGSTHDGFTVLVCDGTGNLRLGEGNSCTEESSCQNHRKSFCHKFSLYKVIQIIKSLLLLICLFLTENRGAVFDLSLFVLQNINLSINRDEMLKKMNSDNEIIDINQLINATWN